MRRLDVPGLPVRGLLQAGLSPRAAVRSAVLSRQHGAWGPDGPRITASWGSRIDRAPTARLELEGPLSLGHWPGGPPSTAPALIQMHPGSTLRVTGWAVVGGGAVIVVGPGATLELEGRPDGTEGVILSTSSRIVCMSHVRIGGGGGLSWEAQVLDTDQHHIAPAGATELPPHTAPVCLGDFVMVGSRASVLKGVTVGEGSVIGTGAVVTRDVPPHSVVAGNPARVVRKGIQWF